MSDWSKALSRFQGGGAADGETASGNRGLQIEEPLIFEQGADGRTGRLREFGSRIQRNRNCRCALPFVAPTCRSHSPHRPD